MFTRIYTHKKFEIQKNKNKMSCEIFLSSLVIHALLCLAAAAAVDDDDDENEDDTSTTSLELREEKEFERERRKII
jgi:hypothetical protein